MKLKFANKKVNGWKDRHLNQMQVMKALETRMRNGFTLTAEEQQFYDDTKLLIQKYSK